MLKKQTSSRTDFGCVKGTVLKLLSF